jgi:hypothetical protein
LTSPALAIPTSPPGFASRASRAVVAAALNVGYSEAGSLVPSVAIDSGNGPFKDKIHVAWPDWRSGRSEILLISSSDKGKTWSKPIVVNDDFGRAPNEGPDDFMRAIAVNSSGVVGVMWYDRRDNPDDLGYLFVLAPPWMVVRYSSRA